MTDYYMEISGVFLSALGLLAAFTTSYFFKSKLDHKLAKEEALEISAEVGRFKNIVIAGAKVHEDDVLALMVKNLTE